jgi:hypothetical protein
MVSRCGNCQSAAVVTALVTGRSPLGMVARMCSVCVGGTVLLFNGEDFSSSRRSLPKHVPWEFRSMVVVAVQGAPKRCVQVILHRKQAGLRYPTDSGMYIL